MDVFNLKKTHIQETVFLNCSQLIVLSLDKKKKAWRCPIKINVGLFKKKKYSDFSDLQEIINKHWKFQHITNQTDRMWDILFTLNGPSQHTQVSYFYIMSILYIIFPGH